MCNATHSQALCLPYQPVLQPASQAYTSMGLQKTTAEAACHLSRVEELRACGDFIGIL